MLTDLPVQVYLISQAYCYVHEKEKTAWLCFLRSCGRLSWGNIDYSLTSKSGGGYAHVGQCDLNLQAVTI